MHSFQRKPCKKGERMKWNVNILTVKILPKRILHPWKVYNSMTLFKYRNIKICNVRISIYIIANCRNAVLKSIIVFSYNVKLRTLNQCFCKPAWLLEDVMEVWFHWLLCFLGTSCVPWLMVCSSLSRPHSAVFSPLWLSPLTLSLV